MPYRVVLCNNFPRPLQPLPTTLSYVTCVMLRALLSWLESRDCFQACISHLAAHDAAGGQSAVSLFCQTSELVSDTESGNKNGESEMYSGAEDICWVSLCIFLRLLLTIDTQ